MGAVREEKIPKMQHLGQRRGAGAECENRGEGVELGVHGFGEEIGREFGVDDGKEFIHQLNIHQSLRLN